MFNCELIHSKGRFNIGPVTDETTARFMLMNSAQKESTLIRGSIRAEMTDFTNPFGPVKIVVAVYEDGECIA